MSDHRVLPALTPWLVLAAFIIMAGTTMGDVPRKMNYQGRITDAGTGEALAGDHTFSFSLYDAAEGGVLLWSEVQVLTSDSAGVFSAILGSIAEMDHTFEGPCWLEVAVDSEILSPRREIVSVPFAFRALDSDSLGGFGPAAFSLAGHSHDEIYVNEGEDSSVTAEMLLPDVVSSIDGVANDGGDIDLVAGANISITPDDANDRITIEATGSAAGDITAVYADDGLSGGATAGDAHISVNTGTGLEISGDSIALASGYSTGSAYDSRFVNEADANSVTGDMVLPDIVSSLDGVMNDCGNIDLVAGSNITITPNDGANTITIAAGGAGDGHSLDAADGAPTDVVYVDNAGDVGIGTPSAAAKLDVRGTMNVGEDEAGHDVNFYGDYSGGRMFWDESKMALRAGREASGDFWSDEDTGRYSMAFGVNVMARGIGSFAVGQDVEADGNGSVALGTSATTYESRSIAMGCEVLAYGDSSVAIGNHVSADRGAVALGSCLDADAPHSFVIGRGLGTGVDLLENNTRNSLMIGFGSTESALFVGGPDNYVGIGTDEPKAPLHSPGPVMIGEHVWTPGSAIGLMIAADDNTDYSVPLVVYNQANDNLLNVKGDGDVGIGKSNALTRCHIRDAHVDLGAEELHHDVLVIEDSDAILGLYSGDVGPAGSAVTFGEVSGGALVDKWAIVRETTGNGDSGLQITYGTDNDQFQNDLALYIDDTRRVGIRTRSVGSYELYVAGDAYATGGWTPSDLRFKQDIEEIGSALDKVLDLRGVRFRWKTEEYGDKGFPEGRHYGVIAQETEGVLPEIVKEGPDGEKAVAYTELIPVLIESVKELRAENDELRDRIALLEAAMR